MTALASRDMLQHVHPVELAFPTGIEPACLPVRSRALVQLSYGKNESAFTRVLKNESAFTRVLKNESAFTRVLHTMWYDVWESNPCCCAENADALPLAERRNWLRSQDSNLPHPD